MATVSVKLASEIDALGVTAAPDSDCDAGAVALAVDHGYIPSSYAEAACFDQNARDFTKAEVCGVPVGCGLRMKTPGA